MLSESTKAKMLNLGSTLGLRREQSKYLGGALMVLGFFLATPPGFSPDDFLNIFIADILSKFFVVDFLIILALTYTVIAYTIFILGALIYPYNTQLLLNGFVHKLKRQVESLIREPVVLIVFVLITYHIYIWYIGYLSMLT